MDQIKLLKERVLLSKFVGAYTNLKKEGTRLKGLCPFHSEKTPSFFVDDTAGRYYCFGCNASGDVFEFLQKKKNLSFMDSMKEVAASIGFQLSFQDGKKYEKSYEAMEVACDWFYEQMVNYKPAQEYLKSRNIDGKLAKLFKLGFAPQGGTRLLDHLKGKGFDSYLLKDLGLANNYGKDFFFNRLIFPIFNSSGKVIAFGGRIFEEPPEQEAQSKYQESKYKGPKYINSCESPVFKKGENLYNQNNAFDDFNENILIVEGYTDVLALFSRGIKNVVAPLGTALTLGQLELIWKKGKTPVLCFDGDTAGKNATWRGMKLALPKISGKQDIKFAPLPEGFDPDTLVNANKNRMEQVIMNPKSLVDYAWSYLNGLHNGEAKEKREIKLSEGIREICDAMGKDTKWAYIRAFNEKRKNKSVPSGLHEDESGKSDTRAILEGKLLMIFYNEPSVLEDYAEELMGIKMKTDLGINGLDAAVAIWNDYDHHSNEEKDKAIEWFRSSFLSILLDRGFGDFCTTLKELYRFGHVYNNYDLHNEDKTLEIGQEDILVQDLLNVLKQLKSAK